MKMAEYSKLDALLEVLENADPDVCVDYGDGTADWRFGRGNIQDMINGIPRANVAPIEALERLRDDLCAQDQITMEGLRKLNTLIGKYTTVHDGRRE